MGRLFNAHFQKRYCKPFYSFTFEKEPREHSSKEHLVLLRLQLDLQDQYVEVLPRSIKGLHRFFKIYVKGFHGAVELRN